MGEKVYVGDEEFEDWNVAWKGIVDADAEVNPNYGLETVTITQRELEQLRNGKRLLVNINDGEYALLIRVK